jgi:hypothetical protein
LAYHLRARIVFGVVVPGGYMAEYVKCKLRSRMGSELFALIMDLLSQAFVEACS